MLVRTNGVAFLAVVGAEQVTIDSSVLRAIWLLLAVLVAVIGWAFFELKRRRKAALRLDRLIGLTDHPRHPNSGGANDYEALLDIISLDERLPAIVKRVEAMNTARQDRTAPMGRDGDGDTPGS